MALRSSARATCVYQTAAVVALLVLCISAPIEAKPPALAPSASLPTPKCTAKSSVQCLVDPCALSTSPCKDNPALTCVSSYCTKVTYLGTPLANFACRPIYVHKATRKVVTSCNSDLPATICAPGSAQARCAGNPCDTTTSPCKGNPSYACVASSCDKLTYLGTQLTGQMCKAIFVDPITRKVVPKCLAIPSIDCDPGSSYADCVRGNPCDKGCPGHPDLACTTNFCGKATYLGVKITEKWMCKAVFVDALKQKVVRSCTPDLPAAICAPGSAQAKCAGDPCDTTTSPCKGNPSYACVASSCDKLTYLGTQLTGQMCKAIFVDPNTRKVVPKCLAIPSIDCDPDSSYADCVRGNPCDKGCPGHPDLACTTNFCGKATYLGVKITEKWMCQAVFVDALKQKVVRSCTPGI